MTSNPTWGQRTSALEVAAKYAGRIKGKNSTSIQCQNSVIELSLTPVAKVAITGVAPQGVGEGTALAFASQSPANLILISRTKRSVEAIADIIKASYSGIVVHTIVLDLASQESIQKGAAEVTSIISTLDILVNNAGCTSRLRQCTAENIDLQFGVNHIGHFLLTKLLFPLLRAAAEQEWKQSSWGATRVVNLSSHGHRLSSIRFHDYNMEKNNDAIPPGERPVSPVLPAFAKASEDGYLSTIGYAQSKTANILFTLSLQQHARTSGVMAYALHPGGVTSHLGREHDEDVAAAIAATSTYWKNSDEGASTSLVAALDPSLNECRGLYLADCQFSACAGHAKDPEVARRLWELSEELSGGKFIIE